MPPKKKRIVTNALATNALATNVVKQNMIEVDFVSSEIIVTEYNNEGASKVTKKNVATLFDINMTEPKNGVFQVNNINSTIVAHN